MAKGKQRDRRNRRSKAVVRPPKQTPREKRLATALAWLVLAFIVFVVIALIIGFITR